MLVYPGFPLKLDLNFSTMARAKLPLDEGPLIRPLTPSVPLTPSCSPSLYSLPPPLFLSPTLSFSSPYLKLFAHTCGDVKVWPKETSCYDRHRDTERQRGGDREDYTGEK